MLNLHGSPGPAGLLETIWRQKNLERAQIRSIRAAAPHLEPSYTAWLEEWDAVFAAAEEAAGRLNAACRAAEAEVPPPPGFAVQAGRLRVETAAQTREFARQLRLALDHSPAFRSLPEAAEAAETLLQASGDFTAQLSEQAAGLTAYDTYVSLEPLAAETPPGAEQGPGIPVTAQGSYTGGQPARSSGEDTGSQPARSSGEEGTQTERAPRAVPIGGHKLPPLPYPYQALEPYIDATTMKIHHDRHHQSYVDGLNEAEKKLAEARRTGDFGLVKHWERELAFHGAGHYLHTLFWDTMSPQGGGRPTGMLLDAIDQSFGSYDNFKRQFSEAANRVEGGGWAILVWSPRSGRLEILTAEKHQNLSQWDIIPLLPLDVWEHAYYLKHQNKRADYIKDWWNVVNWPYVAERFRTASTITWTPY